MVSACRRSRGARASLRRVHGAFGEGVPLGVASDDVRKSIAAAGLLLPLIAWWALAASGPSCRARLESAMDDLVTRPFEGTDSGMSSPSFETTTSCTQGFGTTSLAAKSTHGRHRCIASVSKPSAVAVFQLVQDGRVNLDAPARDYCPELASLNSLDGAPTVRHFLMHRSGMRHSTDAEDTSITGTFTRLGAALTNIVHEPLQFPSGTRTLYTSWGYVVLGCVIETASGQTYADFMKQRFCRLASPQRPLTIRRTRRQHSVLDSGGGFSDFGPPRSSIRGSKRRPAVSSRRSMTWCGLPPPSSTASW